MDQDMQTLCPDEALADVLALAGPDEPAALARLAELIAGHPGDPRLHFLEGSLLAAQQRYDEGRAAMRRAIDIAPDYAIARFQLGLLELSSGDAVAADATLAPLADAEGEAALSLFARGLRHLARDELDAAAELLRRGQELNHEHPLINRDMELIVAKIAEDRAAAPAPAGDDVSAAHLLLKQYADKSTKH